MKWRNSILVVLCCLMLLLVTACGGDGDTSNGGSASIESTSVTTTTEGTTTTTTEDTTTSDTDTSVTDTDPSDDWWNDTTVEGDDWWNDTEWDDPTTEDTTTTTEEPTTTTTTEWKSTSFVPQKQDPNWKLYNIDTFIEPVWKGNIVYNETVMFVPNAVTGEVEAAPLLYKPDKVLEVRSADLSKKYKEGADYIVTADGRIQLTDRTRIFAWNYDSYYCTTYPQNSFGLPSISAPGRYLLYAEGNTFTKTQVCVTYTHSDKWEGYQPEYAGNVLKNTLKKLKNQEPLKIVYNGDSVAAGCNSSGWLKIAPFVPTWTEMVTQKLQAQYGGSISQTNTAVGGMTAEWGLSNVGANIIQHNPDLVVLRFGTNDATQGRQPAQFKADMAGIIQAVRANNPDCEFILVANTMSNQDVQPPWSNEHQATNQQMLLELAQEFPGVAVARMLDVEKYLLQHKRYWDMTANNINHYNDFMVRVQASVVAKLLVEDM